MATTVGLNPRLLRLPQRLAHAEPAPQHPVLFLRPPTTISAAAGVGATVQQERPATRWPTVSSGEADGSSLGGDWQHDSWERPQPVDVPAGDPATVPIASSFKSPAKSPAAKSPAKSPARDGGGTSPRPSPRVPSPGKRSPRASFACDSSGVPRRATPDRTVAAAPDRAVAAVAPDRAAPDRTLWVPVNAHPIGDYPAPQALPDDVLQAAQARFDVPGMLGRTGRCYLQVRPRRDLASPCLDLAAASG